VLREGNSCETLLRGIQIGLTQMIVGFGAHPSGSTNSLK
jgi:hypothetical protein